ncbi:CoA-transferase family III [Hyaloscypha variabilis F]|uniref:CoA-transferase family III n=1 Tax=Hyaloscypha variabilis (strain UAMH 11265 / GT02V1 / F) TaxID=1149755 RepID=A0A2J6R0M3_HYAVF|nr:CoA-transferase family III [Hyaloscypha variabilis F]
MALKYSPVLEARRIFRLLCEQADNLGLPESISAIKGKVRIESDYDRVYFPIPFKETETAAALKAVEGAVACALAQLKFGEANFVVRVDLERASCFLFQAYLATVDGLGKLDKGVKTKLKDTDFLRAQSDPYRRMSANLYETKDKGAYFHIHGSLEATRTLKMLGLEAFRTDLTNHNDIISVIEPAVRKFSTQQLEDMNSHHKQAGVTAFRHEDFLKTEHGAANTHQPAWTVTQLADISPPVPLPSSTTSNPRILQGIKVLELCRIIAGPTIARILGEYGADVIKVTGPGLSDVPFFQVDGNMGKRATEIDLKSAEGRKIFEHLLADVDIILDGYRPGAIDKLGYGASSMAKMAEKRGKGIVYVNENCFGYVGEWADRPGWQQISDCVSGVAWSQGKFMGLNEPVVPPFPMSDYGTGCMGAIAALSGLYHRTTRGGSWHGKVSLLQYDLLLFDVGQYSEPIKNQLRANLSKEFLALRHSHSVDDISGTALLMLQRNYPELFDTQKFCETWYSEGYGANVCVVKPVVNIDGVNIGFERGSRPNGSDEPSWVATQNRDFQRSEKAKS